MLLLQQMIVMFLIICIGWYLGKKEILTDTVTTKFSWIVVNVANPALILSSAVNGGDHIENEKLELFGALAIATFVFLIIMSWITVWILRPKLSENGIYKAMMIFSNIGFMGLPIISSMYGAEAVLYASLFLFPYNILIYTYGIRILQGTKKEPLQLKKIFNIGVVSGILALIIYFLNIPVATPLKLVVTHLSNLAAPLSMMVIGESLIHMHFKEFLDKRMMLFCLLKLIVVPFIGLFIVHCFWPDELVLGICTIMLATPVGSMTAMIAKQQGQDAALASKGIAITTLFSVITIPLVHALICLI